ncbi:MAG TPA: hypothetical protein VFI46_16665 [Jiangellaceae bacterium]|nr:hypothetical protein [Jiangellaceae bacterium]
MGGADSVELKLTVPGTPPEHDDHALGLDPLEAHIRQVYFIDTPDRALDTAGVVVRARRIQDDDEDSVVKLHPSYPTRFRGTCGGRRHSRSRSTR